MELPFLYISSTIFHPYNRYFVAKFWLFQVLSGEMMILFPNICHVMYLYMITGKFTTLAYWWKSKRSVCDSCWLRHGGFMEWCKTFEAWACLQTCCELKHILMSHYNHWDFINMGIHNHRETINNRLSFFFLWTENLWIDGVSVCACIIGFIVVYLY